MPYTTRKYTLGPDDSGRRADRILRALFSDMPLSTIYRLFRDGAVRIAGRKADGSLRVHAGETLEIRLPDIPENAPGVHGRPSVPDNATGARRFAGMVIVETPDLVVVNKPRGMLTHGTDGVDEAARAYFAAKMAASLSFTPAPLHRLDRNTSGALAVSASLAGAASFSAALREGRIGKLYLALLGGDLPGEQSWVDELTRDTGAKISAVDESGVRAEALAIPVARKNGLTLALVELGTGRTHQIRAQAAARGLALAGDAKYGGKPLGGGYILHCAVLRVPALSPGGGPLRVEAPLPSLARQTLASVFGSGLEGILTEAIHHADGLDKKIP